MHFILQVGQKFRVPSIISKGLADYHGHFSFIIQLEKLYREKHSPIQPANGDIYFDLIECPQNFRGPLWAACHFLAGGNDYYATPGIHINYSADLVSGGEWHVPGLFRHRERFLRLLDAGIVSLIENDNELNPASLFTRDALRIMLEKGATQFIRQSYPNGMATDIRESFLITPHTSIATANEHFQAIRYDQRKYMYNRTRREDMEKLVIAAQQPDGYRVYCSHIPMDKQILSPRIQLAVDRYTSCNSPWKQSGGYKSAHVALRFGELGASLTGPAGFIPWDVLERF